MAYTPKTWVAGPGGGTPIDAASLNHLEQGVAAAGGGSTLTPTATKTATYTAAVGDLAMMNVPGGATTLTLPAAPADKSQVGYLAIGATPAAPLTVNRGGAATIGTAAATSITVPLANEVTVYQYDAANTRWLPVSNVKPLTALDGRYLKAWTPSTAYALNDVVSNSGQLYTANSAFTSGASFSGANWTQITGTALTYTGQQTDVLRGDGSWAMPNAPSAFAYSCDMMQTLNSAAPWPWVIQTFASGSWGAATAQATANHPGVTKLTSSTTANSGSFIGTQSGQVQLGGGEETSVIFQLPTVTGAIGYFGFHSANSATAPVFGVWADISGATLTGKANDGTLVTTGTSATLAINTWYRLRVIAVSATQANFYLYDCATGALLWSDVVASHAQPTALLYHSFLVGNSGTTVQDIAYVDYLSMRINRVLTR